MLTDAAINCRSDKLQGLKENVIIGKLIPAGTGINRYRNIQVQPTEEARAAAYTIPSLRGSVLQPRLRPGHRCRGAVGRLRLLGLSVGPPLVTHEEGPRDLSRGPSCCHRGSGGRPGFTDSIRTVVTCRSESSPCWRRCWRWRGARRRRAAQPIRRPSSRTGAASTPSASAGWTAPTGCTSRRACRRRRRSWSMLHGGFGTGEQAERAYGWDQLADTRQVRRRLSRRHRAGLERPRLLRTAQQRRHRRRRLHHGDGRRDRDIGIDRSRVYATGISNGGMMSYTLACNSDLFAAIGPDSATQLDPCASPHPTSVMHIHGTTDRLIRYNGGPGARVAHIDGPRCRRSTRSGATSTSVAAPVSPPTDRAPRRPPTARATASVVLITFDAGGHDWPPFATTALWQFFAAHRAADRVLRILCGCRKNVTWRLCPTRTSSPTRSRRWRTTTPPPRRC